LPSGSASGGVERITPLCEERAAIAVPAGHQAASLLNPVAALRAAGIPETFGVAAETVAEALGLVVRDVHLLLGEVAKLELAAEAPLKATDAEHDLGVIASHPVPDSVREHAELVDLVRANATRRRRRSRR